MLEEKFIRDEEMNEEMLLQLLERGDVEEFREEFLSHHPYDQAGFYEKADSEIRHQLSLSKRNGYSFRGDRA